MISDISYSLVTQYFPDLTSYTHIHTHIHSHAHRGFGIPSRDSVLSCRFSVCSWKHTDCTKGQLSTIPIAGHTPTLHTVLLTHTHTHIPYSNALISTYTTYSGDGLMLIHNWSKFGITVIFKMFFETSLFYWPRHNLYSQKYSIFKILL